MEGSMIIIISNSTAVLSPKEHRQEVSHQVNGFSAYIRYGGVKASLVNGSQEVTQPTREPSCSSPVEAIS